MTGRIRPCRGTQQGSDTGCAAALPAAGWSGAGDRKRYGPACGALRAQARTSDLDSERCQRRRAALDSGLVAAERLANVRPPLELDVRDRPWPVDIDLNAIVCINLIHIAPWSVTPALFAGARDELADQGVVYLYGPDKQQGRHTALSNAGFRSLAPRAGSGLGRAQSRRCRGDGADCRIRSRPGGEHAGEQPQSHLPQETARPKRRIETLCAEIGATFRAHRTQDLLVNNDTVHGAHFLSPGRPFQRAHRVSVARLPARADTTGSEVDILGVASPSIRGAASGTMCMTVAYPSAASPARRHRNFPVDVFAELADDVAHAMNLLLTSDMTRRTACILNVLLMREHLPDGLGFRSSGVPTRWLHK